MSVITFQPAINFDDPTAVQLPVSTPEGFIPTWVDESTVELLAGRKLSLGSHGYPACWHEGAMWPLHRLIMGLKIRDGKYVDHLDGDRMNNLRSNLKVVTAQENAANRRPTAATGYRGVDRNRYGRYTARARLNGHAVHLGTYATAEEAAEVSHQWRLQNMPGYQDDPRIRFTNAATAA